MGTAFWIGIAEFLVKLFFEGIKAYIEHHKKGTGEPVHPVVTLRPKPTPQTKPLKKAETVQPVVQTVVPNAVPQAGPPTQPETHSLDESVAMEAKDGPYHGDQEPYKHDLETLQQILKENQDVGPSSPD